MLDLPFCRFCQTRDVVMDRLVEDRRTRLREKQMELRLLCSFLSTSEKQFAAAQRITLLDEDIPEQKPSNVVKIGKREFDVDRLPSSESIAQAFARGVK